MAAKTPLKLYEASPAWLKKHGLKAADAQRLFEALCTMADYEGVVQDALAETGGQIGSHREICKALRYLVDGE